jgi:hypothetical protein
MTHELAKKSVVFILEDTQKNKETVIFPIRFFGALAFVKLKKEGSLRCKNVVYSAAESLRKGYRKIEIN